MATQKDMTFNGITLPVAQLDSPHDAQTLDNLMNQQTNPNLLDNWYFVNPVNQRGETSYTGTGYTIDRWAALQQDNSSTTVTVTSSGLQITTTNTNVYKWIFRQFAEAGALPAGTYTLSILVKSITGTASVRNGYSSTRTNISKAGLFSITFTTTAANTDTDSIAIIQTGGSAGFEMAVTAMKLELGSQQTLAHQDSSGNWVLNEIPNYAEQLARCQRYQLRFSGANPIGYGIVDNAAGLDVSFSLPTPVTMRSAPTVAYSSNILIVADGISQLVALPAGTTTELAVNGIHLRHFPITTALTLYNPVTIFSYADILFDANI